MLHHRFRLPAAPAKVATHPPEFSRGDYNFRVRRPEPLPLSQEAERKQLSEEYNRLYNELEEDDEEGCACLDEIEARVAELEHTGSTYTPDVIAIARPEDLPDDEAAPRTTARSAGKPEYSASLIQSLTEAKSAAISAALAQHPDIALAAVIHGLALSVFDSYMRHSTLQISAKRTYFAESSKSRDEPEFAHHKWAEAIPSDEDGLWEWCLAQNRVTLLELLAYCAARTVNAVQMKQERPDEPRLKHARALTEAPKLDMTQWFVPRATTFFSRVGRSTIVTALTEAKGTPAKRS